MFRSARCRRHEPDRLQRQRLVTTANSATAISAGRASANVTAAMIMGALNDLFWVCPSNGVSAVWRFGVTLVLFKP